MIETNPLNHNWSHFLIFSGLTLHQFQKKTAVKTMFNLFMPYRINPVVGGGEHAILSTATKLSKFGLPLIEETKERIIELYKSYKWMNGIHAHVGSQGIPIHLFANSVKV